MYHDIPFILSGITYSIITTVNYKQVDESEFYTPGHFSQTLEFYSGLVFDTSIIPCLFEYRVHFLGFYYIVLVAVKILG